MKSHLKNRDAAIAAACKILINRDVNGELKTLRHLARLISNAPAPGYFIEPATAWNAVIDYRKHGILPSKKNAADRTKEIASRAEKVIRRRPGTTLINAVTEVTAFRSASRFFLDEISLVRILHRLDSREMRRTGRHLLVNSKGRRLYRQTPNTEN